MDNREEFETLMQIAGVDKSDPTWAASVIVWDEATKVALSRSQTAPHITWTDHDRFLFEAACECMSPDQVTVFEQAIADDDLRRRFANCVRKRFSQDVARVAEGLIWHRVEDKTPWPNTEVLVAVEFFCEQDWRIKVGGVDSSGNWTVYGATWTPTHWAHLPKPNAAPQPPQAGASDELASMTRMFHAACSDLGAINEALGLDPNDGGAEPIIDAIRQLQGRTPPEDVEAIIECLGDDAAKLREANPDDEMADNMEEAARMLEGFAAAPAAPAVAPHADDLAVDILATAMKEKLADARAKGRKGWQCMGGDDLSRMLREHVEKGDPRDVANFCAFLFCRGESIDAAPAPAEPKGEPQSKYDPRDPGNWRDGDDATGNAKQQDFVEFGQLQGWLWQNARDKRPAGGAGLAGWALAVLKAKHRAATLSDEQMDELVTLATKHIGDFHVREQTAREVARLLYTLNGGKHE
jgi:hypothetical protein